MMLSVDDILKKPCRQWESPEVEAIAAWLLNATDVQDRLMKIAFGIVRHYEDARDLVSEGIAKALRCNYDPAKSPGSRSPMISYVSKIVRHAGWRERPRREVSLEGVADAVAKDCNPGLGFENTEHLQRLLRQLPDKYREAIELCDLQQLSCEEAATKSKWSCSRGAMRARHARALHELRRLGGNGEAAEEDSD